MIIWVVERYTNINDKAKWGHCSNQGLFGTCMEILVFTVCTVGEYVCKVSDIMCAPHITLRDCLFIIVGNIFPFVALGRDKQNNKYLL